MSARHVWQSLSFALLFLSCATGAATLKELQSKAEAGNAHAQLELAFALGKGTFGPPDQAGARLWLDRSASSGDPEAQYIVGVQSMPENPNAEENEAAFRWLKSSADQGLAEAQMALALLYFDGNGVAKNHGAGLKLVRRAAAQGYSEAQMALALFHYNGEFGLQQDPREAATWFAKAASQGLVEAQRHLGKAYGSSEGVNRDNELSYFWISLAAAEDETARKWKPSAAEKLTPSQIEVVDSRVERWKPVVVQRSPRLGDWIK